MAIFSWLCFFFPSSWSVLTAKAAVFVPSNLQIAQFGCLICRLDYPACRFAIYLSLLDEAANILLLSSVIVLLCEPQNICFRMPWDCPLRMPKTARFCCHRSYPLFLDSPSECSKRVWSEQTSRSCFFCVICSDVVCQPTGEPEDSADFIRFIREANHLRRPGQHLLVHCRLVVAGHC